MAMSKTNHQPLMLQITVLSAEGLKMNSFPPLFSQRLRPFITLSPYPPTSHMPNNGAHLYQTVVDEAGGSNPTWGNKFDFPIDTAFFSQNYASIYLQIFSKRCFMGEKQLGWCRIPSTDIIEGCCTAGSVRHLSYRVRDRDGSTGHGVVNVAVRLVRVTPHSPATDVCQMAIGIPVALFPALGE